MRVAVGVGVHQDRAAWLPIAPGSPDLLVIRLDASRQGGVNHRADIGLVDPHPERNRRHHHLDLSRKKLLLYPLAMLSFEPGVIRRRGEVNREFGRHAFGLLSGGRIHDARSARLVQQQFARQRGSLGRRCLDHFNRNVGAPKSVDEPRRPPQPQLLGDVVLHQRRRRGGKRNHRRGTQHW